MGVLGLVPFLQKKCPGVIRELPARFKALSGKTLVLDATLITTRFHFSNNPHERRHILGWYRLLNELRLNEVKVICVFDGKERHTAKKAENDRRRDVRDAALARGRVEQARASRLREFEHALKYMTPELASEHSDLRSKFAAPLHSPLLSIIKTPQKRQVSKEPVPSLVTDTVEPSSSDIPPLPDPSVALEPHEDPFNQDFLGGLNESLVDLSVEDSDPRPSSDEIARILDELHEAFRESLKLHVPPASTAPVASSDTGDGELGISLTRSQHEIALGESEIWDILAQSRPDYDALRFQVGELAARSEAVGQSYQRTSDLPKEETFAESKIMIEALGIPWIEAEGEYEAEGIASSLVKHGIADYVGSEDTDVLVYQAPLLRNITSQSDPLVLVQADEIPSQLSLTSSAFIDFALLIGTDFTPRLRGLGPHRALKLLQDHGSIEKALEAAHPRYQPEPPLTRDTYLERVQVARRIFSSFPTSGPSREALTPKHEYDAQLVHEVLVGFELERHFTAATANDVPVAPPHPQAQADAVTPTGIASETGTAAGAAAADAENRAPSSLDDDYFSNQFAALSLSIDSGTNTLADDPRN
ncbi:PIN domain-like protein [Clavulina sp. PMI_390]|nr:PIN domain-like protein [Clavulina sp. PMI_390]